MKRFSALITAFTLLTSYTANAEFSNRDIEKIWNSQMPVETSENFNTF